MQAEEVGNVSGLSTGLERVKIIPLATTKTIVDLTNHFLNDDELIF